MKPFRKNVAIAIDGGGIKGTMVAKALAVLENHMDKSAQEIFRLAVGTSTGSIISAGIGAGLSGERMHQLYTELGEQVFRPTLRSRLWLIARYRYTHDDLEAALQQHIGTGKMGDFWSADPQTDVVITIFDLTSNHTGFVKPWKEKYADWPIVKAVLSSCTVPTYFPPVEGRYVDGGVGSYSNPCYVAAYEAKFVLGWDPAETTLISFGTGRDPHVAQPGVAANFWAWDWLGPLLGAFLQSAADQQVHLVHTFFEQLDFRRFQVDLRESLAMDDAGAIPALTEYGEELGQKVINDDVDWALDIQAQTAPKAS